MSEPTLGLILAGGLARRMGGGDKALISIGGKTILAHVIARLAPQCDGLLLNANGDPARFADYALPVVADSVPGFAASAFGGTGKTSPGPPRWRASCVRAMGVHIVAHCHEALEALDEIERPRFEI